MTPPPSITDLTNRLLNNPRVRHLWGPAPTYELSSWLVDELLVSADVDPKVRARIKQKGWKKVSSVLSGGGLPAKHKEVVDIEIWKPLSKTSLAVAPLVAMVRHDFGSSTKVSPNHLLVPCYNSGCYCPARAPLPIAQQAALAQKIETFVEAGKKNVNVVVIDTGYISHPALAKRARKGGFHALKGQVFNGESWVNSPPDGLYKTNGRLQLLDGHGTFTAGVIAERCKLARIALVGIRAVESAATESAVVREIYRHADADIIVPVFAFHELAGIANWTFPNILPQLGRGTIIVCPAGNEDSPAKHFPAALDWPKYPVIGIGSFATQNGSPELSNFSNYGNWVQGYTVGENVRGPHVTVTGRFEDGGNASAYKGWSSWSGTSFAAPKVAAAIINHSGPGTARNAATTLLNANPPGPIGAAGNLNGRDLRQAAQ
jgi:hypothetical protein